MHYKYWMQGREDLSSLGTGIHTRLNENLRISSIYRAYDIQGMVTHGWETILWNKDKIVKQYDVLNDAETVVSLHLKIRLDYEDGIDITKEDNNT